MLRSVPLEVLAQQAVRVFVDAALPATIWSHVARTRPSNEGLAKRKRRLQKRRKYLATRTAIDKRGVTYTRRNDPADRVYTVYTRSAAQKGS